MPSDRSIRRVLRGVRPSGPQESSASGKPSLEERLRPAADARTRGGGGGIASRQSGHRVAKHETSCEGGVASSATRSGLDEERVALVTGLRRLLIGKNCADGFAPTSDRAPRGDGSHGASPVAQGPPFAPMRDHHD